MENIHLQKKIDLGIGDKVNIEGLLRLDNKYGKYASLVILKVIDYASSLIPEVTKEHNNIDEAMRLGFNWIIGPFEMLDQLGIFQLAQKNQTFKLNRFLSDLFLQGKSFHYGKK